MSIKKEAWHREADARQYLIETLYAHPEAAEELAHIHSLNFDEFLFRVIPEIHEVVTLFPDLAESVAPAEEEARRLWAQWTTLMDEVEEGGTSHHKELHDIEVEMYDLYLRARGTNEMARKLAEKEALADEYPEGGDWIH